MRCNTLMADAARMVVMLALFGATSTAAPTDTGENPSLSVLIRDADGSYAHNEIMARDIQRRGDESSSLIKRATATVQACYTSSCTNCYVLWDGTFTSNSACLSATNTACLIISNLSGANIQFWNREFHGLFICYLKYESNDQVLGELISTSRSTDAGCNGANTVYRGCSANAVDVSAPGTNSLGVHTGC